MLWWTCPFILAESPCFVKPVTTPSLIPGSHVQPPTPLFTTEEYDIGAIVDLSRMYRPYPSDESCDATGSKMHIFRNPSNITCDIVESSDDMHVACQEDVCSRTNATHHHTHVVATGARLVSVRTGDDTVGYVQSGGVTTRFVADLERVRVEGQGCVRRTGVVDCRQYLRIVDGTPIRPLVELQAKISVGGTEVDALISRYGIYVEGHESAWALLHATPTFSNYSSDHQTALRQMHFDENRPFTLPNSNDPTQPCFVNGKPFLLWRRLLMNTTLDQLHLTPMAFYNASGIEANLTLGAQGVPIERAYWNRTCGCFHRFMRSLPDETVYGNTSPYEPYRFNQTTPLYANHQGEPTAATPMLITHPFPLSIRMVVFNADSIGGDSVVGVEWESEGVDTAEYPFNGEVSICICRSSIVHECMKGECDDSVWEAGWGVSGPPWFSGLFFMGGDVYEFQRDLGGYDTAPYTLSCGQDDPIEFSRSPVYMRDGVDLTFSSLDGANRPEPFPMEPFLCRNQGSNFVDVSECDPTDVITELWVPRVPFEDGTYFDLLTSTSHEVRCALPEERTETVADGCVDLTFSDVDEPTGVCDVSVEDGDTYRYVFQVSQSYFTGSSLRRLSEITITTAELFVLLARILLSGPPPPPPPPIPSSPTPSTNDTTLILLTSAAVVGGILITIIVYLLSNKTRAEGVVNVIRALTNLVTRSGKQDVVVRVVDMNRTTNPVSTAPPAAPPVRPPAAPPPANPVRPPAAKMPVNPVRPPAAKMPVNP